jgi:hypothetical protein
MNMAVYYGKIRVDGESYDVKIAESREGEARAVMLPGLSIFVSCAEGAMEKTFDVEFIQSPEELAKKVCGEAADWILDKFEIKGRK